LGLLACFLAATQSNPKLAVATLAGIFRVAAASFVILRFTANFYFYFSCLQSSSALDLIPFLPPLCNSFAIFGGSSVVLTTTKNFCVWVSSTLWLSTLMRGVVATAKVLPQ
jgi:hypothetical protein